MPEKEGIVILVAVGEDKERTRIDKSKQQQHYMYSRVLTSGTVSSSESKETETCVCVSALHTASTIFTRGVQACGHLYLTIHSTEPWQARTCVLLRRHGIDQHIPTAQRVPRSC